MGLSGGGSFLAHSSQNGDEDAPGSIPDLDEQMLRDILNDASLMGFIGSTATSTLHGPHTAEAEGISCSKSEASSNASMKTSGDDRGEETGFTPDKAEAVWHDCTYGPTEKADAGQVTDGTKAPDSKGEAVLCEMASQARVLHPSQNLHITSVCSSKHALAQDIFRVRNPRLC